VRPLVTLVSFALATGAAGAAAAGDDASKLRAEIALLEQLERVGGQVVSLQEALDDLGQEQGQLTYQIDEATRKVAALERRIATQRRQLRRRLRSLYKLSRGGAVRLVLDGAGGGDLQQRLAAARLILRRDVRELQLYRRERRELLREHDRLRQARDAGHRVERQLEQRRAELEKARGEQRRLVRQIERRRASTGGKGSRALLRQIAELRYRVSTAGGLGARRGRLPRPVSGAVVGSFGVRRLEGGRRLEVLRQGITIRPGSRRARVQAVAAGTVRLTGPLDGYGQIVLIEHAGGYFTLYGFLSRIEVSAGQRVKQGEPLGRAGLDPLTGDPAAYFELRRGQRALDPAGWLRR